MHASTTDRCAGFSVLELLMVVAIAGVLAAIAVPALIRARIAGNEVSAQSSLKVVNLGQMGYAGTCGNDGFATSFLVLALKPAGASEGFVPADLAAAAPVKAGYQLALGPGAGALAAEADCHGIVTYTGYHLAATPEWFGMTGGRSFATSQADTIWALASAVAPTEPFGSPAVAVG